MTKKSGAEQLALTPAEESARRPGPDEPAAILTPAEELARRSETTEPDGTVTPNQGGGGDDGQSEASGGDPGSAETA